MEKKAKEYFVPREDRIIDKKYGFIVLAIGLFIFIGITVLLTLIVKNDDIIMASVTIGVVVSFAGLLMLVITKSHYLSGAEYDEIVSDMIYEVSSNAREYLGIDCNEVEEIDPIFFEGYKYVGANKIRQDETDKLWRSDLFERVIVFFTRNELHLYKVFLNSLTGKITETTDVLFYDDVVSVSTKNETEKIGDKTIEYISFNLVSKGGNNINIALNNDKNRQRSINAMRAMIKEKKTS